MTTKKYIFLILITFCISLFQPVIAQKVVVESKNSTGAQLVSNGLKATEIEFSVESFFQKKIEVQGDEAFIISLEGGSPILEKGAPDLAKLTASVVVSETDEMEIEVIQSEFTDYNNIEVAPSKGNLYRNQDPDQIDFTYGKVYTENAFFPGKLAELRKPYILREFRGQTVVVYPLQYNPVSKTLRVYSSITLKVKSSGKKGINTLESYTIKRGNSEYQQIYKHHFINYDISKYSPVGEEGNFLIITPAKYYDAVLPLAQWKNKRGLPTEIVEYAVSTTGTTANALFTYLKNYYQQKGITYLLLVGDANDIPSLYASGDSDVAYSYMAGNDSYPEFFVGRMSGSTTTHIENQVQKSIYYERDIDASANWLSDALVIASAEGGGGAGDDGESDIAHMNNIKTDLLSFTYTNVATAYDPGASATQVANAVNAGVSNINYVGHGSDTYWVTTGFDVNDCNNLTNYGKYPFIFDVACVNGNFHGQTCFAEGFTQARKNNQPTGALAIVASTINQSWDPPMDGQDEMIDILVESYENNIKRSFSGIAYNGCLHMNDEYGSAGDEMTDTWTTFGDPSVLVRTEAPTPMDISFNGEILIGTPSMELTCNAEGALVCLSLQNTIIATDIVRNGLANLEFEPFTDIADLDLVITGFNHTTFQSMVKVIPAEGPYITLAKVLINDKLTNNNGQLDNGETVFIDAHVKNVGIEEANELKVTLTTNDEYLQVLQAEYLYGTLNAGRITGNSTLKVKVSDMVPNFHVAHITLTFTDHEQHLWEKELSFTVNAPQLQLLESTIVEDGSFGDGNGKLEPGESGFISLAIENTGNNTSGLVEIKWDVASPYISLDEPVTRISKIDAGQVTSTLLKIKTSNYTPNGTKAQVAYNWANADTLTHSLEFVIGQPPLIEFGDGTTKKYQYPFYNYYKSNKTQILFLSNEFSSGSHLIDELSFDLASITQNSKHRKLKNFTVVLGTTPENQIANSYLSLANTDTVMFSDSIELAHATGWFALEIIPYLYNVTDGNLVVEIYWGINDSYCASTDRTSVFCTETAVPTVAYGYADNEFPAAFDGTGNVRPNVKFSFVDQNLKLDTLQMAILNSLGEPVSNAQVKIGSELLTSDSLGFVSKYLAHGEYLVSVFKQGFMPANQWVMLNDYAKTDTILVYPYGDSYQVSFNVSHSGTPVEGALVFFNNQQKIGNNLGEAIFEDIYMDNYPYKVVAEGYEDFEQEVSVSSDTLFNVGLTKTPTFDVVFNISENGSPLQGVNVQFNGTIQVTNSEGVTNFSGIVSGESPLYFIDKWGYYSVSDTLDSMEDNQEVVIQLTAIPDLLVHVTNKSGDMEKAKVIFQGQNVYSNSLGEALFADIEPGMEQSIHFESQGFYSLDTLVDISANGGELSVYLFKKSDLLLHVTDGQEMLHGIGVTLGTLEKTTDSLGMVQFKAINEASQVPLTINVTGYYPVNQFYNFSKDVDFDTTITLEFIPDVEFQVVLKGEPVVGATLLFNNTAWVTNSEGKINIADVVKGDYNYSFEQTGYYSVTETLTVASLDVIEVVEIKMVPDVTFVVTSNNEPLADADILLETSELATNSAGIALFADVFEGTYSYRISKAGYTEHTGTVVVSENDVTLNVDLQFVSVNESSQPRVELYPNPANKKLHLKVQNPGSADTYEIVNNQGKIVLHGELGSSNNEIDVDNLPAGIYLVRVYSDNNLYFYKQVID